MLPGVDPKHVRSAQPCDILARLDGVGEGVTGRLGMILDDPPRDGWSVSYACIVVTIAVAQPRGTQMPVQWPGEVLITSTH